MTQPGDQTPEERARALRRALLTDMEKRKGFRRDQVNAVIKSEWDHEWDGLIATALADERRRGRSETLRELRLVMEDETVTCTDDAIWEFLNESFTKLGDAKAQEG